MNHVPGAVVSKPRGQRADGGGLVLADVGRVVSGVVDNDVALAHPRGNACIGLDVARRANADGGSDDDDDDHGGDDDGGGGRGRGRAKFRRGPGWRRTVGGNIASVVAGPVAGPDGTPDSGGGRSGGADIVAAIIATGR
jgi:hypothetical protein